MTFIQALILGVIQGLTEFLPVSSSGHLVLSQKMMRVDDPGVTFELFLHFGTLLSVLIYFWKPLWRMTLSIIPPFKSEYNRERKMIGLLALASVPAACVGFSPLKDSFESVYEKPAIVGLLLVATGGILFVPRLLSKFINQKNAGEVNLRSATIMGIGQAFAILPGISRSGSTIVAGMAAGAKSSHAAEFSFLMAIPAIAGGFLVEVLKHGKDLNSAMLNNYIAGGVVAFVAGLAAIYTVLAAIRRGKFEWFGIYCLIAGIAAFCYFKFGSTTESTIDAADAVAGVQQTQAQAS
ncbi:MAG: undecaprenyl-diphosphatase [Verrucomicrobiales bacterium]|jgi:undecaprenyl-diphosphatase